ncbi:Rieske (2Fe-2S) protein [Streptomyces sp. NPDC050617]|uniref:Rieske (2Fe-2S) protein n=1 Tax=Streptomyces sp. NPDC050617 TaxID=3154628 RepID=UPI003426C9F2
MTHSPQEPAVPRRRTVIAAAGGAGLVAALAACGGSGGESPDDDPAAKSPQDGADTTPATPAAPGEEEAGTPGGQELARTSEIPQGGGKVFKDRKMVVTQPAKGSFKAFSAVCTHQGCLVGDVANGTINCPCHGSKYSIEDGSVRHGPTTKPLPATPVSVQGDSLRLG